MKLISKRLFFIIAVCLLSANALADPVWIDVRTETEYANDHINGDTNIPLSTIDAGKLAEMYGKDAEINLYCHSGNRAGKAKAILDQAGFTNVKNAGGIDDVRELRNIAKASPAP